MTGLSKADQASGRSRRRKAAPATDPPETVVKLPDKRPVTIADLEAAKITELAIDQITEGRNVRLQADDATLRSLTDSIKRHGVLQPIRVRPAEGGRYQIVLGWRRWQAARAAKLRTIPVVVATPSDRDAFVQGLVENLQRQDLNAVDEAKAFQALLAEDPKLTQDALGKLVGRSQPYIANALRLLETAPEVQAQLEAGTITVAHAKSLASLPVEQQATLVNRVVTEHVTSTLLDEHIRQEKEQERRAHRREEEVQTNSELAIEVLKAGRVKKDQVVVLDDRDVATMVQKAGWKNAVQFNYRRHNLHQEYKCDCTAVHVDIPWRVDENNKAKLRRVCSEQAHSKAHDDEVNKAKRTRAQADAKVVSEARRKVDAAFRSETGLTVDGLRATLYTLLTRAGDSYGDRFTAAKAFVKKHDGAWIDAWGDGSQVWQTIEPMQPEELAREIVEHVIGELVPNVFRDSVYNQKLDAGFRRFMVAQLSVDESMVWGRARPETLAVDKPLPKGDDDEKQPEASAASGALTAAAEDEGSPA